MSVDTLLTNGSHVLVPSGVVSIVGLVLFVSVLALIVLALVVAFKWDKS